MSIEQIKAEVAKRYGLTVADLEGPRHLHRIAHPRQEAMWRARQVKGPDGSPRYSLTFIGRRFGNRHHATVLHAVGAHEARTLATPKAEREASH